MLADPGDVEGWSERVLRVLDDPELAGRIGAAGKALSRKEFDYRVHSQRLLDFMNQAAGTRFVRKTEA
jgi:glycosyltransferase involved in cell wall biosynthesis